MKEAADTPGGQPILPLPETAQPSLGDGKDRPRIVEDLMQVPCERRRETRQNVCRALVAVPVLPDGSPDWEHRVQRTGFDLCSGGIGLELESPADFPTSSLVVLLQDVESPIRCAGLELRHTRPVAAGVTRVGGSFSGFAEEILRPENLAPKFHLHTMEFAATIPDDVLCKWAAIGVLRQTLHDRVQLCPQCHGLPTFRQGCPNCGSATLINDQLIHHFACAHVGLVSDFESQGGLICPKCRVRHLVVGSDYEYCTGLYRCLTCHWSTVELEQVAQCLRCEFRFPAHQAYEQEVRGYCAHRLDPVALLAASGSPC